MARERIDGGQETESAERLRRWLLGVFAGGEGGIAVERLSVHVVTGRYGENVGPPVLTREYVAPSEAEAEGLVDEIFSLVRGDYRALGVDASVKYGVLAHRRPVPNAGTPLEVFARFLIRCNPERASRREGVDIDLKVAG